MMHMKVNKQFIGLVDSYKTDMILFTVTQKTHTLPVGNGKCVQKR